MQVLLASTGKLEVSRTPMDRGAFDEETERTPTMHIPCCKVVSNSIHASCACSSQCIMRKVRRLFPFLDTLWTYKVKKYLVSDFSSGISIGMVHIPQGMGFAMLANVSPVYGLYSSFFPVLIYFFFGSSRHVSVGTMAVISLVVGSVVQTETKKFLLERGVNVGHDGSANMTNGTELINDSTAELLSEAFDHELEIYKASIASAMSLVASGVMLMMGVLRLGIITTLMPTTFIGGFTTGAAFHIATSQIKFIFGIKVHNYEGILKLPYTWIDICWQLRTTNIPTLVLAIVSIAILVFCKEFINEKFKEKLPVPIPIEILVLILATIFSHFLHFTDKWNIQVVGTIPRGIPTPFIPPIQKVPHFLKDAIIAAILSFAITISMADIFSRKHKYFVDTNQELIANGLSYGLSSFFYCFMGAAAPPRCFVLDSAGGKTQVASIFTAAFLLLVLLIIGPLFASLPNSVLASIIVAALFPLFKQFHILPRLWKLSKADFSIWIVTWTSSILFNMDISLGIGIGWSVLTVAFAAMCSRGYVLGQAQHQDLFAPTDHHKMVSVPEGVVIYKYESSLFFATIKNFKNQLFKATVDPQTILQVKPKNILPPLDANDRNDQTNNSTGLPEVLVSDGQSTVAKITINDATIMALPLCAIIIDCSPFAYVDLMGLNVLKQLCGDYAAVDIRLILANCTDTLLNILEIDGQVGDEGGDKISVYPTIQDALGAMTSQHTICERIVTCL